MMQVSPQAALMFVAVAALTTSGCSNKKPVIVSEPIRVEKNCQDETLLQRDLAQQVDFDQRQTLYVTEDGMSCRY